MAFTDKDAIRQLLGSLHAQSNVRRINGAQNLTSTDMADLVLEVFNTEQQAVLHEAEAAKTHPLEDFRMSQSAFAALCNFLVDGGGVADDTIPSLNDESLVLILWQAVHDRNQAVFWKELPHLFKSWVKQRGLVATMPGGGVMVQGTKMPLPDPPKFQFT